MENKALNKQTERKGGHGDAEQDEGEGGDELVAAMEDLEYEV